MIQFLSLLTILSILNTIAFEPRLYGEWSVWHSNTRNRWLSNRVIVSIRAKRQFEIREKRQQNMFVVEYVYQGKYKLQQELTKRDVESGQVILYQDTMHIRLLSIGGVGLDELPIYCTKDIRKKVNLNFDLIGKDEIFLSKYDNYFHLVRHTRLNEPTINIPFSTLLFTNLFGIFLNAIYNEILYHHP